jgi:hypothetical protein
MGIRSGALPECGRMAEQPEGRHEDRCALRELAPEPAERARGAAGGRRLVLKERRRLAPEGV